MSKSDIYLIDRNTKAAALEAAVSSRGTVAATAILPSESNFLS
jgi:hypothetical protein